MLDRPLPRRSARPGATLSLTLALFGCGGRASVRPGPTAPARVVAPTGPTARVTLDERLPSIEPLVGLAALTGMRALVSGRRAERRGSTWRFSEEAILVRLQLTAQVGGRWIFATGGGAVFVSDDFLGPLRRLGTIPASGGWCSWSRGRFAFAAGRRLWTTDGATISGPVEFPSEVVDVAFEGSLGAVVLRGGWASLTRDGGLHWEPMEVGRSANSATFDGRSLVLETVNGAFALDAAGNLTAQPDPTHMHWHEHWDPSVEPDIARDWRREHGDRSCLPALQLANGTCVGSPHHWISRARVQQDWYRSREIRLMSFLPDEDEGRFLRAGEALMAFPWGRGAALLGDDLQRTDDGLTVEAVRLPRPEGGLGRGGGHFVFSDDGVHAAMKWPCAAAAGEEPSDGYCALLDGRGRWRDFTIPDDDGAWIPVEMHGDLLLLIRDGDEGTQARVVSVETGRGQEVEFAPRLDEFERIELAWLPDGSLFGVGRFGGPTRLLMGRPGASLAGHALPDGASGVTFADARRGYAWGDALDALWRTEDGGDHWSRVPVPAASGQFLEWSEQTRVSTCERDRCVAGPWSIEGWGVVTPERSYVFGDPVLPRRPDSHVE